MASCRLSGPARRPPANACRRVYGYAATVAAVAILFSPAWVCSDPGVPGPLGEPQRTKTTFKVPPTPTPVPTPQVLRSSGSRVTLAPAAGEAKVVLAGRYLDSVGAVELIFKGATVPGVTARVVSSRPASLEVAIQVSAGVADLSGLQLRLTGRAAPVVVPLNLLRVDVAHPAGPPPPTFPPATSLKIKQALVAPTKPPAKAAGNAKLRTVPPPIRVPATPTPALVGPASPLGDWAVRAGTDADIWTEPRIDSVPPQGRASEPIEITGRGLGVPSEPRRTQVLFYGGRLRPRVEGDVLSASYRSVQVEVPRGAVTGRVQVTTPGGQSESATDFEPVYLLHYPPDVFAPGGGLGFMHFYDSVLVLAHGQYNSLFQVSSEMQVMGFDDQYFTMAAYEQRIDAVLIKTTLRVRIPGSNRSDRGKVIRSHPLTFTVDGTNVVIAANFESEGWEYIGEYETQDVLTGEIYWKHFMDVDINDLAMTVTIPLEAGPNRYLPVVVGEIGGQTTFTTRLAIFDSPPFEVDETPIKTFIQDDVDAKVHATFNSEGFRMSLAAAFSRLILDSPTFQGVPLVRYEVLPARDGGFDIKAVLGE